MDSPKRKLKGAPCPKCKETSSEYQHAHEAFARWSCGCGAGGFVQERQDTAGVHPHWTARNPLSLSPERSSTHRLGGSFVR